VALKSNPPIRRGGQALGVLARLTRPPRRILFSSRKDAETQRNCSPLGKTFRRGGLPLRLGGFARRLFAVLNSYVELLA